MLLSDVPLMPKRWFKVPMTSSTMKLLPAACLFLLPHIRFADGEGSLVVKEGSDVILPCSVGVNLESKLFDWKKDGEKEVFLYDAGDSYSSGRTGQDVLFRGRVSHFKDELKHGNASILIRNTKVADSGDYTCVFPRLQSQKFHIQLLVGAASKPSVTIMNGTNDRSLLQCVVRGAHPKPKVEWQDSSGHIVPAEQPQVTERGGSYDIILQTTVTRSDTYRCVSTQEEISHRIHTKTYVHISGAATEPYITTQKTDSGMMLQCVARDVSSQTKVQWLDSSGKILPAGDPQVSQRGGSYDITLLTAVIKSDTFRCVVTHPDNSQTSAEIYLINETSSKVIFSLAGVIVGIIGTLAVVGVVLGLKSRSGRSGSAPNSLNKEKEDGLLDSTQQP